MLTLLFFSPLLRKINMFTLCAVWMGKDFQLFSSSKIFLFSFLRSVAAGKFSLNFLFLNLLISDLAGDWKLKTLRSTQGAELFHSPVMTQIFREGTRRKSSTNEFIRFSDFLYFRGASEILSHFSPRSAVVQSTTVCLVLFFNRNQTLENRKLMCVKDTD